MDPRDSPRGPLHAQIRRFAMKDKKSNIFDKMTQNSKYSIRKLDHACRDAGLVNRSLLMDILMDNSSTEYGEKYHFSDIRNEDEYREKVPLTSYEDYEPYIDRMVNNNETNLITSYPVVYYASTSGTSGSPKKIPVTDRGLAILQDYIGPLSKAITAEYYQNTMDTLPPEGKILGIFSMQREDLPCGVPFGAISAVCFPGGETNDDSLKDLFSTPFEVLRVSQNTDLKYLHALYALKDESISSIFAPYISAIWDLMNYIHKEWRSLVNDIYNGVIPEGISMPQELRKSLASNLKPDPARAGKLEAEFRKGFDKTIMTRIWPNLSVIVSIWAGNFYSYARKLQTYSGRSMPYYTLSYVSSEGLFAAARHPFDQFYIMAPSSCFFEFIPDDPQAGQDDSEQEGNPKTLLIDELEQGKSYELVITNQSGFYRYRMGDVIKVMGFYNESPMICFKYRKNNIVSVAGEKFTEDHLLTAIKEFERHSGEKIVDFSMYADKESEPGRYVILMEPEKKIPKEKYERYANLMQNELARASTSYAHYVIGGNMGVPKLVFLQKETYSLYRELKMFKQGISENQLKPVRVLRTEEQKQFFQKLEEPLQ